MEPERWDAGIINFDEAQFRAQILRRSQQVFDQVKKFNERFDKIQRLIANQSEESKKNFSVLKKEPQKLDDLVNNSFEKSAPAVAKCIWQRVSSFYNSEENEEIFRNLFTQNQIEQIDLKLQNKPDGFKIKQIMDHICSSAPLQKLFATVLCEYSHDWLKKRHCKSTSDR